jgi:hypothetical protein
VPEPPSPGPESRHGGGPTGHGPVILVSFSAQKAFTEGVTLTGAKG